MPVSILPLPHILGSVLEGIGLQTVEEFISIGLGVENFEFFGVLVAKVLEAVIFELTKGVYFSSFVSGC